MTSSNGSRVTTQIWPTRAVTTPSTWARSAVPVSRKRPSSAWIASSLKSLASAARSSGVASTATSRPSGGRCRTDTGRESGPTDSGVIGHPLPRRRRAKADSVRRARKPPANARQARSRPPGHNAQGRKAPPARRRNARRELPQACIVARIEHRVIDGGATVECVCELLHALRHAHVADAELAQRGVELAKDEIHQLLGDLPGRRGQPPELPEHQNDVQRQAREPTLDGVGDAEPR